MRHHAPGIPHRGAALAFALLAALCLLAGCAGITVKPVPLERRFNALDRTAINSPQPSEMTLAFLKQRDLDAQWREDPEGLIRRLDDKFHADPGLGTLFALVELSHLQARRLSAEPDRAAAYDLSCAVYAYLFLFDPAVAPPEGTLRPNARLAAEFHNRSLARYVLYARTRELRFSPGDRLSMASGSLELRQRVVDLPFAPEEFSRILLSFSYEVSGLDVTYSVPGLGVPLILERDSSGQTDHDPARRFLPRIRQVLSATLFLRVDTVHSATDDGERVRGCSLEVHDPMRTDSTRVNGYTVPLETDTTTPLAWMAAHAPPPQGIKGLMDPAALKGVQGLYMLQPYEKDKIPVVFVHGLISSPMTWIPMLNGLMGDPELRRRYQFWYFSYPTGNPVLYSASLLRQSLESARAICDPEGNNPAFNSMLVVGHSMGGLLAKCMVQEGGDRLWDALASVPPSRLKAPEEVRDLVEKLFFYKPLPFVSEAVFISAPHRGSEMALGTIGAIGRALVTLPLTLARASATLLATLSGLGHRLHLSGLPTGIDSLSPKNPMLKIMADTPVAVPFHSIIGNEARAGVAGGTDGVVPYWSSHLDGAASELIVKSGHGAHEHPLAIREVRRIMLEHAARVGNGETR